MATTAFLVLTQRCNLRCDFCFYNAGLKSRGGRELSTEEIESVYPLLQAVSANCLIITGGEPFLRKDLFEIVGYFARRGIMVGVLSSGTLLNEHMLREFTRAGLSLLSFPMDGPSSEPSLQRSGHENVIALCESARQTGLYTSVTVTVTSKNHRFVRAMYEELDGRVKPNNVVYSLVSTLEGGIKRLGLRLESESERRDVIESLRPWAATYGYVSYLGQMEQCLLRDGLDYWRHCTMKESLVIETDGSIRPCFSDDTPCIGTIFDGDIAEKYKTFRRDFCCQFHSEQCITQFQRKD